MTRVMAMESTIISMVQCMKATGEMIYSTEVGKKAGLMAPYTKESMMLERNMDLDCTIGMMDPSIMENGMRIRLKDLEHTAG